MDEPGVSVSGYTRKQLLFNATAAEASCIVTDDGSGYNWIIGDPLFGTLADTAPWGELG